MKFIGNKVLIVLVVLIHFSPKLYGQSEKTGENLSDSTKKMLIHHVENFSKNSFRLADFKDKALILDFSSLGCSGCILALPGLDSLQRKYHEKLQVIWVVPETDEEVKAFLAKLKTQHNKLGEYVTFPIVTQDTALRKAFLNTKVEPIQFWLNAGKIIYMQTVGHSFETGENAEKIIGHSAHPKSEKELKLYKKEQELEDANWDLYKGQK